MRFILKNGMYGDVPNLITPQQTFNDTACWNYIMQRRKNLGYFGWNSREAKEYLDALHEAKRGYDILKKMTKEQFKEMLKEDAFTILNVKKALYWLDVEFKKYQQKVEEDKRKNKRF